MLVDSVKLSHVILDAFEDDVETDGDEWDSEVWNFKLFCLYVTVQDCF